jgi:transcriptional regulator with XRE-family HTH domain
MNGPGHPAHVDRIRFGRSVKTLRKRRRWSQQTLADAARISRTVAGRIERGELRTVGWRDLEAVALALDGQLGFEFRWRGADLDRLLDADHAATVDALARVYRSAGWDVMVEATFSEYGERGSIDLLASHPETGDIAVNEVKASIADVGSTVMGIDRKARLAQTIARKHGLTCRAVSRFLVIADGQTSRRRVAEHSAVFATAFPVRGRAVRAWIRQPTAPPISALFFLSSGPAEDGIARPTRAGGGPRPGPRTG